MTDRFHLVVEEHPSHDDIAFLEQRIIDYNYSQAAARDGRGLACFVRDDVGQIIAGVSGYTWAGMAEIEFLWVDDSLRGQGVGSQLLAAVEVEARQRGCALIITSTYSFQAPEFYRRHGYEVVGTIQECPPGHTNLWLKKGLTASDVPRIIDMVVTEDRITAQLADGRSISVPLAWSWRLSEATPDERGNYEIIGDGRGVHWPDIDEDISAAGMLCGVPARSHRSRPI